MGTFRLLAAAALLCAPATAQDWFDTARYFPATDTIGFSQPGSHPGDFFTLGDHDDDGVVDLLLGEYGPAGFDTVRVYRGDGTGDFTPLGPNPFPAGTSSLIDTPEMADVDGDGLGDLLVRQGNTGVAVMRSNGDGTFMAPIPMFLGGPVADVELGDSNGDGVAEILTFAAQTGRYYVRWWSWNGSTFSVIMETSFLSTSFGTGSVAIFHFDSDGVPDVAVKPQAEDVVRVYRTTGAGLVADQVLAVPQLTGSDAYLVGDDLDGDGDDDLLMSWAELDNPVFQPLVNAGGALTSGIAFSGPVSPWEMGWRDPFLTDWDGDGDLDAVSHSPGGVDFEDDRELFFLENDGNNGLSVAARALTGRVGRGAGVADLNLDGRPDFAAPGAVLFGDGTLHETHAVFPFLKFSTNSHLAIDWEGDGDLDLWSDQGQILPNDGAGGFPHSTAETVFTWPEAPDGFGYDDLGAIGDLSGDGHPDMLTRLNVFTGPFGFPVFQEMRLLVDQGTGTFVDVGPGAPLGASISGGSQGMAQLRDMDMDGDLDVIGIASGALGSTGYWQNDGTGYLAQLVDLIPSPIPMAIHAVGDPDQDGDLDLLAVRYDSIAFTDEAILWRKSGGGYSAESLLILPGNAVLTRLRFLDLDGDSDEDVVVPEDFYNELHLYESAGGAQLAPVVLDNMYTDPTTLAAEDVDGDGLTDLVTASYNGGNSTVTRTIGVHRRSGPGLVYEAPRQFVGRNHIGTADLDGDGDLDLYGASRVLSKRWHPPAGGTSVQVEPGFAGTGGIQPLLGASGAFRVGEQVEFHVARGVGAAPALLGVGLAQDSFSGQPLPAMTLHLDQLVAVLPTTLGGPAGAAGKGTLSIPHVVKPGELGLSYSMQVFLLDLGSPTLLSATNGLWFQYGP